MPTDYSNADAATRLAAVREAINRCLLSQDYGTGAVRKQSARLGELRAMEKELMAEVANSSGGGGGASVAMITPVT